LLYLHFSTLALFVVEVDAPMITEEVDAPVDAEDMPSTETSLLEKAAKPLKRWGKAFC